jgi:putative transposase
VFAVLRAQIRAAVGKVLRSVRTAVREALRPTPLVTGFVHDICRTHDELIAENAALRQQLVVASRAVKRPSFFPWERALLVLIASVLPNWQSAVLLAKPETVLRWHREGFRLFWRHRSKVAAKQREPRLAATTIELIQSMALDNRTWGAERIRGELLKLGIRVAKRTIQRHIRAVRPPSDGQRWRTFLRNHTVWACDFLQVYDVCFRPLFALFVVDVNTKQVIHFAVTRAPSERWTAQQLRQLTPFGHGPQVIVRDRDSKFGTEFDRVAQGAGIRVVKTAVQAPLMNSVCERFLGSARRECLDHIIILGQKHLESVLGEYIRFFNACRPHQGLYQRVPAAPAADVSPTTGKIVVLPVLGGLHHA